MARSLRPRKERPSYASLMDSGDEGVPEDDGASNDDFQPSNDQDEVDEPMDVSDAPASQASEVPPSQIKPSITKFLQPKKKSGKGTLRKEPSVSVSLPRTATGPSSNRPQNAPSAAGIDHRQRAGPLFLRSTRVERLVHPPAPFKVSVTTPTSSWNFNKSIAEKITRAHAYNIGRGPIWELLEDRSWWKESLVIEEGMNETEATRRPRVYESVKVDTPLVVINEQQAQEYLPRQDELSNEPSHTSVKCYFGPPSKNTVKELKMFDCVEISDDASGAKAHVFFAGGPVWCLDWCPIYAEDHIYRSFKQYVAVAPLPSKSYSPSIGRKCRTPSSSCIQIWSYAPKSLRQGTSDKGKGKAAEEDADSDFGKMACELVLCIDCGTAQEIKWCPLPSHDSWADLQPGGVRKLGLLAGTFEDGSLSLFSVPDPEDLGFAPEAWPQFVKVQPIVRIELEETCIWTLDWANSELIAVGCTNGSVAVYNIREALSDSKEGNGALPTHYFSIHQSAIRSIRWIPIPTTSANGSLNFQQSPSMIVSGGYDGCEMIVDIRDGYGNILNRTRDVVLSVTHSRFSEGIVSIDLDNTVMTYSLAPNIFGRGNVVIEAGGPIWSLNTSDYHPFLALGSADGSALITNMLRPTRRTASTPFLYHKIFQMDYNRTTGEYRMLDQFLPHEIPDRSGASAAKKGKKQAAEPFRTGIQGTGAWSPEVSVTRVSWNNGAGLARAPLLASATASGICRIDWLLGHFQDERVPYGSIESIRNEIDTSAGLDEEET
ncbi:hypothetical protein ACEPAG_5256 [Sanghuangporus baumii]